eukprot:6492343-Amphidinium_carterae.2
MTSECIFANLGPLVQLPVWKFWGSILSAFTSESNFIHCWRLRWLVHCSASAPVHVSAVGLCFGLVAVFGAAFNMCQVDTRSGKDESAYVHESLCKLR